MAISNSYELLIQNFFFFGPASVLPKSQFSNICRNEDRDLYKLYTCIYSASYIQHTRTSLETLEAS